MMFGTNMNRVSMASALVAAACVAGTAGVASATVYTGNGATGFGGPIGSSTLTVTDGGATINISLATSGFGPNSLAIYLDTKAGGFNNNSTFTDEGDNGRRALSGFSAGNNGTAPITFAPGFGADYGIAVEPASFAGIFDLSTASAGAFTYVGSAGLDPTATTTINLSVDKAAVGLPVAGGSFSFEASLIDGRSGYRSDETIGTSVSTAGADNPGSAPNPGFTGTQVFSTANVFTYGAAVPEPTTLAALGGVALVALRRRR